MLKDFATAIVQTLRQRGFQAYLVGGCVRDLLLGREPKDYDVATNATPAQVMDIFPETYAVGAQFGVVLVPAPQSGFPADVSSKSHAVEVATFRSDIGYSDGRHPDEVRFSLDPREDVARRDFTINGMLLDPVSGEVLDFVGGRKDLEAGIIRTIGDPEQRFSEDKLRMLRAVRFAAKLDFSIEPNTEQPIKRLAYLLDGVPPARLFDEVLKLFLSGFGLKAYRLLQQYGLFEHLFPQSAAAFAMAPYAYAAEMLERGLANTDERIAADKPVTPTFLFAVLLWSAVLRELNERQAGPAPDLALLMQACDTVLRTQQSRVAIPRRFAIPMRELLMLQPRFNRRSGVKALSILQHPRFRAAYDFLLLRAQVGVADPELAKWWTDIQVLPQEERVALVQARPAEPAAEGTAAAPGRRRRRRRRGGAARS